MSFSFSSVFQSCLNYIKARLSCKGVMTIDQSQNIKVSPSVRLSGPSVLWYHFQTVLKDNNQKKRVLQKPCGNIIHIYSLNSYNYIQIFSNNIQQVLLWHKTASHTLLHIVPNLNNPEEKRILKTLWMKKCWLRAFYLFPTIFSMLQKTEIII